MKQEDFLKGKIKYLNFGQDIWIEYPDGGMQKFLDLRGWGAIQNLFPNTEKGIKEAEQFQDAIGQWVARTLNEKLNGPTKFSLDN